MPRGKMIKVEDDQQIPQTFRVSEYMGSIHCFQVLSNCKLVPNWKVPPRK